MFRSDRTIPPGGKGEITLEIKTIEFQGRIQKTARVFSNDPTTPKLTIAISGNIWVPILVSTNRILLRGMVGEEVTNTAIVKGQKQEPLELSMISVSPPEKVAVQLQKKEDNSYVVVFKNTMKDEGFYSGEVKLQPNYVDEPEIRIQIMGAIQSHVLARPRMVTFGSVSKKHLNQLNQSGGPVVTRDVMVYLTKSDNLKIVNVESEKQLFTVTKEELEPGRRYKFIVKPIPEKLSKGSNEDSLRIHTNQEHRKLIHIPIYLTITE